MEYYCKLRPLVFYTLISIWIFLITSILLALYWSQAIPEVNSLIQSNLDVRFPLIETNTINTLPYKYQGFFTMDRIRYYSVVAIYTSSLVFIISILGSWQHDNLIYDKLSRVRFLIGLLVVPSSTISMASVVYNLINGLSNPLNPMIVSNQVIIVTLVVIYLYFNNTYTAAKYNIQFRKYQLTHILYLTIYSVLISLIRYNTPLVALLSQLIIIGITIPLFINFTVKKVGI
ncbi:hypothetical protein RZE82_03415 [Mollicutes bacterium LVI A0039]|nr:hypothetical protein RZE82_03415 [Mollicutes bacterium LVI A0039]